MTAKLVRKKGRTARPHCEETAVEGGGRWEGGTAPAALDFFWLASGILRF